MVFRMEFGRIVFISLLLETLLQSGALKMSPTESISVLKRPSDSGAALFSVTPRDRAPVRLWHCPVYCVQ